MSDVLDPGAAQPRFLAVDRHFDARVVERLLELDVAEGRDATHVRSDFLGVLADQLQVGADDADSDRGQ